MIIRDDMTSQKKDILIEILYNWEAVLAWDFTKIGKVKKKVASLQNIWIIEQKTWQIASFQISRALTSIVIDML